MTVTVQEALQQGTARLKEAGIDTPMLDSTVLLTEAMGISKEKLFAALRDDIDKKEYKIFQEYLNKRLQGKPVAYITKHKEFYGLDFYVDERVLVPRPDTEILIEHAILLMENDSSIKKVHDLCTGSGCIAVTLKKFLPNMAITASDISHDAENIFRINCSAQKTDIPFHRSNLFNQLNDIFDMVVTNPPYLTKSEVLDKEKDNWPEPMLALDGGADGLDLIRDLVKQAYDYIRPRGYLVIEAAPQQMKSIGNLMKNGGFTDVRVEKDLAGRSRIIIGRRALGGQDKPVHQEEEVKTFKSEIKAFKKKIAIYAQDEQELILDAAHWAEGLHSDQKRASGEPYIIHPLAVASILVDLRMDSKTIIAALLHDVLEDTAVNFDQLSEKFDEEIASLVDGVTKISILKVKNKSIQAAETIRKMFFAMVKDMRVILIKLADKLHNMDTLQYMAERKRKTTARECLDIFAPLAGRLGISWIKSELEDLSLKHLRPSTYYQIKKHVSATKITRKNYLVRVKEAILAEARKEEFEVDVHTRAKHFYSIYKKMKLKGKNLDEIFDMLGLRILCDSVRDCYSILGIVHRLWKPIEGRFKDYIGMPKNNNYQSLHTTVMCYDGKLLEIQIRTKEMHHTAEYGVAAHWLYKEKHAQKNARPEDIAIVNKLKKWDNIKVSSSDFLADIKRELLRDSIYVFTPRGEVIELPQGATAIDFAYHIHTEVGNHCLAAKADSMIIPLDKTLSNNQVIEIITNANARPHLSWIRYAKTAKTRGKIRQWLNRHDENIIIDRNIVAKKKDDQHVPHFPKKNPVVKTQGDSVLDKNAITVSVEGDQDRNMIRFAKCCTPSLGDPIIGFVSRGRGIIVHRRNCSNLKAIRDFEERKIFVEWETISPKATRRFRVVAKETFDFFSEIESAVKKYKGHLIEGRIEKKEDGRIYAAFTIELDNKDNFSKVMKGIRILPSVLNLKRVSNSGNNRSH